jgi:hypothetical protein
MMTKPILLLAAATTIGAATVAHTALELMPAAPAPAADVVLTGACDASAGLLLDDRHLLVADDEDKKKRILRVYDLTTGGAPAGVVDVTAALQADDEVDLEGLTRFGSRIVAVGSHSHTKKAAPAPSRHRIIAIALAGTGPNPTLGAVSRPYQTLVGDAQRALDALPASDPLSRFVLDNGKAPNDGGLSIEAVSDTDSAGELLIGLRSPLAPGGKAIVLRLTNAAAVLDSGAAATFGPPITLDLGAQGVRDLVRDGGSGFRLIAGNSSDGGTFALWTWSGPGPSSTLKQVGPIDTPAEGTSAEGLVLTTDRAAAWILFDEGQRLIEGKECKDLKEAGGKSFHARRLALSPS